MGYQAIDIGQIDDEYNWWMMGANKREYIDGKLVAEMPRKGYSYNLNDDDIYANQIKLRINA